MTKPINVEGIEKATGRSWEDWVEFLDGVGARDMAHPDIAKAAYDHMVHSGAFDDAEANSEGRQNPSMWWSQSVTVAYEQHIGRRAPGQRSDGTYEVSVTKVLGDDMAGVMDWWLARVKGKQEFNGVKLDGEPRVSMTPRAQNWRADLADGSKIVASASLRDSGRAMISIAVQKLESPQTLESWRTYWKNFLAK